jgi:glycosyltransferase involved in cell wall biosynthesis
VSRPRDEPPLVSVVIPSYNYGRYVSTAVHSVWAQDYAPIEIIAVDDGSTDDTRAVLQELATDSPVPMKVLDGGHRGVCAAMNLGLTQAEGSLISVLHADDVYLPTKVRRQVEVFDAEPDLALVHGEYVTIDEHGETLEGLTSALDPPPARGDALDCLLWLRCDVRSMTMMYPTDLMRRIGGYDERLPLEDWQSILRLAAHGRIGHVAEPLVLRRVHGHNYSMNLFRQAEFDFGEIAEDVLLDVAPPETDLDRLRARHVASVVTNAAAEGNMGKAHAAFRAGWRAFPVGRPRLAVAYLGGVRSRMWMTRIAPALPTGLVLRLRRLKGSLRSLRGRKISH